MLLARRTLPMRETDDKNGVRHSVKMTEYVLGGNEKSRQPSSKRLAWSSMSVSERFVLTHQRLLLHTNLKFN